MKILAFALALVLSVPAAAEARCFLFFCFHPAHTVTRPPAVKSSNDAFCKGITAAFAKSKNTDEDAFTAAFPERKQDKVRDCLDK